VQAGAPVLGLFASSSMADAFTERRAVADPARTAPTLREMTEAALTVLSRSEVGFFLMVEAGQIDWAGHDNDAGWMLAEMQRMDDTLAALLAFVDGRDDTLLVVTADHETGGFGFSYGAHDKPDAVPPPGPGFGGLPYKPSYNFGRPEQLDLLARQSAPLQATLAALTPPVTAAALVAAMAASTPYTISEAQAAAALAMEPDRFAKEDDAAHVHVIHDFRAYYPYLSDGPQGVLGRVLSEQQNVVWSTGTHTHTPVPVFAVGPAGATAPFGGLLHHAEVGALLAAALGLADPAP